MRRAVAILLALSLGLASAFLVACGDRNKLLPQSDASAINDKLDSVSSAVSARDCTTALDAINAAERQAQSLPGTVDSKLQATLQANLEHVAASARTQCTQSTQTKTTTPSTATTPTTTQTTETTQPTTTTTTETQPTTQAPPTTGTTDTSQSGGIGAGTGNGAGGQPGPQG